MTRECQNGSNHQYSDKDFLGEGSFGEVYKCQHKTSKEIFAVKFFKSSQERSIRKEELLLLSKLKDKTIHIIKLIDEKWSWNEPDEEDELLKLERNGLTGKV